MSGRLENKIITENKIINKISNSQYNLIGFYNYMSSKYEYKTKELYIRYIMKFLDTIQKDIKDITLNDINNYLANLSYKNVHGNINETSGTYRATVHSALSIYYIYLFKSDLIPSNIMLKVPRPKKKNDKLIERIYLKTPELQDTVDIIKTTQKNQYQLDRDLLIFMTFLYTGMRCTALTEINIDDINTKEKLITFIDKRNKKRTFSIDDDYIRMYKTVCRLNKEKKWKTNALFVSNRGNRISSSEVSKIVEKYTQHTGKHITPHKLRRSYGKNMYNETGDIYAVQVALGHEDVRTTELYVDIDEVEATEKGMIAMKKNVKF